MFENATFYPTPPELAFRMVAKIKHAGKVLEPSAGKGDLIEALKSHGRTYERYHHRPFENADIYAIEIDPTLQATLRGKGVRVLDSDFLEYAGPDKFDTIIMNPPFDNGDRHLLKAIEILYRGEIVCLLNAETVRNPHTNTRKELTRRLDELGADIEFIQGAFNSAERKTGVEVALVYLKVDRHVEDDLFADCDDHGSRSYETVEDKHEVSTGKTVDELVAEYNQTIQTGTDVIINYYRNFRRVGKYLGINAEPKLHSMASGDLTERMQGTLNALLKDVRVDYWRRTLDLKEVRSRLTSKKQEEFEHALNDRCHMDFTEGNIRQFVINLIGSYEQTLTDAVLDIFDMFTIRHSWHEDNKYEKNIHYYNGWKTNKAFKVGKRVVVPARASYGSPFFGYNGPQLDHRAAEQLGDIDKVMNYFDGGSEYLSMADALKAAFAEGELKAENTYFKMIAYKKGTIHLTFKDMDILRRFNTIACRGKGWLPEDYGKKDFARLTHEEQAVAEAFEGRKSYEANAGKPVFAPHSRLQIVA